MSSEWGGGGGLGVDLVPSMSSFISTKVICSKHQQVPLVAYSKHQQVCLMAYSHCTGMEQGLVQETVTIGDRQHVVVSILGPINPTPGLCTCPVPVPLPSSVNVPLHCVQSGT